jgi:hypothetical protein
MNIKQGDVLEASFDKDNQKIVFAMKSRESEPTVEEGKA